MSRSPNSQRRSWLASAVWAVAAVAGYAALLELYDPGPWSYGILALDAFELDQRVAFGAILFQFGIASWALRRKLRRVVSRFGIGQTVALLAMWIALPSVLSRSGLDYGARAGVLVIGHGAGLMTWILAITSLPYVPWKMKWRNAVPLLAAASAVLVSGLLAWWTFDAIPHVPDEVAYLMQAKTYASGRLYSAPAPEPALFEQFLFMVHGGKWFSVFPPGWPAVLAIGAAAGLPWLVNPVLAGAVVLIAHRVFADWLDSDHALLATVLFASSPLLLIISATYMAHTWSLLCALMAVMAATRMVRAKSGGWAALSALAVGMLFSTRPAEGVVVGTALGLWVVSKLKGRFSARIVLPAACCGLLATAPFFANNLLLTGELTRDPIQLYFDETFYPGSNTLGFGADKGNFGWGNDVLPGHGPLEAAISANFNLTLWDLELNAWSFGSLLFIAVGAAMCIRHRKYDLWFGVVTGTILVASLYWYSGADVGPRYWFQCLPAFVIFSIVGASALAERLGAARRSVSVLLVAASLAGSPQLIAWRSTNKYHDHRGVVADVRDLWRAGAFDHAIVLVRSANGPAEYSEYASAFPLNSLPVGNGPVFARDPDSAALERLRMAFPERPIIVLEAPSVTGSGFEIR